MHDALARPSRAALFAATISTIIAVAACGGGGGGDAASPASPPPAPPAAPAVSVSGVVIDGPIQGATVCLDLDQNGSCDAGEPTSAPTDAQGRYMIAGLTSAQAAAPLVAVIPASAIDADHSGTPIGTAYKLFSPAGKGAVISPLTHLVQAAVARGKSLAQAEAGVASQLQVPVGSLYDDYTASSSSRNAAIASMAPVLAETIRSGTAMSTEPVAGPDYVVANLVTYNAGGHYERYYFSTNAPDDKGLYTYYDLRRAVVRGHPDSSADSHWVHATPQGWVTFDGSTPNVFGHGSPYRSVWGGFEAIGTRTVIDVSGQPIAQVVAMAQDLTVNSLSTVVRHDAVALTGTMPPGATVVRSTETVYANPLEYDPGSMAVLSPRINGSIASLQDLLAQYGSPGSSAPSVSLMLPNGTVPCGTDTCWRDVQVHFGAGQTVTYIACDTPDSTGVGLPCQVVGTGHYTIGVAVDGKSPLMTLTDVPPVVSAQAGMDLFFVEREGRVFIAWRETLPRLTRTMLGRIAFEAVAAQLGITPIPVPGTVSPASGRWSLAGAGFCPALTIDAVGWITGRCYSGGNPLPVFGTVAASGDTAFQTATDPADPWGQSFTGTFSAASGSGSVTQQGGVLGNWTATRLP